MKDSLCLHTGMALVGMSHPLNKRSRRIKTRVRQVTYSMAVGE